MKTNSKWKASKAPSTLPGIQWMLINSFPPSPQGAGVDNIPRDTGEEKTSNIKKVMSDHSVGPGSGFPLPLASALLQFGIL